jgi:uncharacterized protein
MAYALVTGASKGIGKAIAHELASRKHNLVLVARSEALLQGVAQEISSKYGVGVEVISADLSAAGVAHDLLQTIQARGLQIDILVNNAGYGLVGRFDEYSMDETRNMMTLNMNTLVEMCHVFLPMLKAQPKAYIMNIASSTAYQALPLMSVYAASKVFVLNFSRGIAHELRKTSVSVTSISPGATTTEFNDRANLGEKARKAAQKVTMTAEDVARQSVDAMFSGKTEHITGFVNKLGAFAAWLLPKSFIENTAAGIYT